MSVTVCMRKRK